MPGGRRVERHDDHHSGPLHCGPGISGGPSAIRWKIQQPGR